jgi:hypothetical protein
MPGVPTRHIRSLYKLSVTTLPLLFLFLPAGQRGKNSWAVPAEAKFTSKDKSIIRFIIFYYLNVFSVLLASGHHENIPVVLWIGCLRRQLIIQNGEKQTPKVFITGTSFLVYQKLFAESRLCTLP